MDKKNKVVYGIYRNRASLENGVDMLKERGFTASDISALLPDQGGTQELAATKGTKAPEGAAAGAGSGAVVGGALGWLVGIGALAIPGVGPLIAAGPIVAALAGAGVGGALAGIGGALIGLGIPEYEAKRYEGFVKDGGLLLSVHTDDSDLVDEAKEVLQASGAREISSTTESRGDAADYSKRDKDVQKRISEGIL